MRKLYAKRSPKIISMVHKNSKSEMVFEVPQTPEEVTEDITIESEESSKDDSKKVSKKQQVSSLTVTTEKPKSTKKD